MEVHSNKDAQWHNQKQWVETELVEIPTWYKKKKDPHCEDHSRLETGCQKSSAISLSANIQDSGCW